jgi:hypothetical protein
MEGAALLIQDTEVSRETSPKEGLLTDFPFHAFAERTVLGSASRRDPFTTTRLGQLLVRRFSKLVRSDFSGHDLPY